MYAAAVDPLWTAFWLGVIVAAGRGAVRWAACVFSRGGGFGHGTLITIEDAAMAATKVLITILIAGVFCAVAVCLWTRCADMTGESETEHPYGDSWQVEDGQERCE